MGIICDIEIFHFHHKKRLIWFMPIERLETVLARKASYITVIAHPCLQNFSLSYYRTYNSISRQQYFVNFFILMSDCCIAESIRKDIKRYLTKWKYCLKFKEETFRFRFNYCLFMFIWLVKGTFSQKILRQKLKCSQVILKWSWLTRFLLT